LIVQHCVNGDRLSQ